MNKIVLSILSIIGSISASAQQPADTFHIYFDLNIATLNKNAARKIDLLIYNDRIINGSGVMVVGYADFLGSEGYNKNLSMRRAQSIKDYLVKYGVGAENIVTCMGKGEVHRKDMTDKDGYPDDRRVDIVVNNGMRIANRSQPPRPPSSMVHKGDIAVAKKPKKDTLIAYKGKDSHDITDLTTLQEGQLIRLKNVYFPSGSHIIKPESFKTLEQLYETLEANPKLKISIEGHICCVHNAPDALDNDTNEPVLSVNRARAIYLYLIDKGIDENRLEYKGFGFSHPEVEFERSEADAEKNRRVEIRVLSTK